MCASLCPIIDTLIQRNAACLAFGSPFPRVATPTKILIQALVDQFQFRVGYVIISLVCSLCDEAEVLTEASSWALYSMILDLGLHG